MTLAKIVSSLDHEKDKRKSHDVLLTTLLHLSIIIQSEITCQNKYLVSFIFLAKKFSKNIFV